MGQEKKLISQKTTAIIFWSAVAVFIVNSSGVFIDIEEYAKIVPLELMLWMELISMLTVMILMGLIPSKYIIKEKKS